MIKTNPIGVRFDSELLEKVKSEGLVASPQKALNLYEKSFIELVELKVELNNKPERKSDIIKKREPELIPTPINQNPLPKSECVERHPLWKEGDPVQNGLAFMMKYGVLNYDELEKAKSK